MNSAWGGYVADIVSFLVSGLIVGYVFAGKLREESKMASIGKVVVLFAVVTMFFILIWAAAIGHYNAMINENLQNTYHTSSWTNGEWVAYETMMLLLINALYIVFALVFGFIGLYLGSMRKPSAKT